jgi:MBG domain (YGX type)
VNNETLAVVTGAPVLTTVATTNSPVGVYPIKISTGTLAAVNYNFVLSNGVLTVVSAGTAALVTSALNPARTNQNITFVTRVSALNPGVPAPSGQVRFKCNGTNSLGAPVNLTNGATTVVIPAAVIASSSSVLVTAEFSDPAGNFNSSSNTITQTIVISTPPPPSIGAVSITPPKFDGTLQAKLIGTPGQAFVLEASSDLIHWTSVSTNIADTNGIATLVESNAIAYPSRFYRGRTAQ